MSPCLEVSSGFYYLRVLTEVVVSHESQVTPAIPRDATLGNHPLTATNLLKQALAWENHTVHPPRFM